MFAEEAGKFVCATAGHKLECLLAAHGSGAVQLSKDRSACVLHVDIGGGTTKLALIDSGIVLGVAAFAVGGRCIATDASGAYTRVDDSAVAVARELSSTPRRPRWPIPLCAQRSPPASPGSPPTTSSMLPAIPSARASC